MHSEALPNTYSGRRCQEADGYDSWGRGNLREGDDEASDQVGGS